MFDGSRKTVAESGESWCLQAARVEIFTLSELNQSGAIIHTRQLHSRDVCSVVYDPSGSYIAVGPDNRSCHVVDAESGALVHTKHLEASHCMLLDWAPTGQSIAIVDK